MTAKTPIPVHWTWVELRDVADCRLGKMLDKAKNKGQLRPYLRNINVQWGRVDTTDLKTMRISDDERETYAVVQGDLLVCEGGEPGRCAIWDGSAEVYFQKALHRVRTGPELRVEFLQYFLEYAATYGLFDHLMTGSTIKHLPARNLAKVMVPLPDVHEQDRILGFVNQTLQWAGEVDVQLADAEARTELFRLAALGELARTCDEGGTERATVSDVADIVTPPGKLKTSEYAASGEYPVIDQGEAAVAGYSNRRELVLQDPPYVCFGDHTRRVKLVDRPFIQGADGLKIIKPQQGIDAAWLARRLEAIPLGSRGYARHFGDLRRSEFGLPTLADQRQTLERYATADRGRSEMSAELERLRRLLADLRKSVLHSAFTGRFAPGQAVLAHEMLLLDNRSDQEVTGVPARG
ncbi:MAG TPA: restriction endonuclease subunit S [Baekduia sp.]|nr:restriction endonuclease subunit S [Baekduia sp.]